MIVFQRKCILGSCNFKKRMIAFYHSQKSLDLSFDKLKRLADLGECCVKIAQTLGNERRNLIRMLNLVNNGTKEYPIYDTDMHWSFGITGGLEIYASQLCDGPRYVSVIKEEGQVFEYNCSESAIDEIRDPRIITYVKGSWELKIPELYKTAREILDKQVLTLDDIRNS